jgi:very-short-patch-repair endonuclease
MNLNKSRENQSLLAKRRNRLIEKATLSEGKVAWMLDYLGERYLFQKGFLNERTHYIVDFYLPKRKLCLEVDGGYHDDHIQAAYDARRDEFLTKVRQFRVLRVSNDVVDSIDAEGLFVMISEAGKRPAA